MNTESYRCISNIWEGLHMLNDKLEQFYIDMQKELSGFSDNKTQYPDTTLYHYTDVPGLIGILSSRRLWMNHYEKLNDTNEIKHARDLLLKIIDIHKFKSKHAKFWQTYHDKFETVLEVGDYYICSFSSSPDNEHLWNHYAKDGGVAIGFRKQYFSPSSNMNKRKRRFNLTTVQMVHYHENDFTAYAHRLITLVENNLEVNNPKMDVELASYLTTFFLTDLPKIKNKNWSRERECRLYQFGYKDKINQQSSKQGRIYAIPKITTAGKNIVLRKFKQADVCEIWMGSSSQISKNDIQKLLHKYQFTKLSIFQHDNSQ